MECCCYHLQTRHDPENVNACRDCLCSRFHAVDENHRHRFEPDNEETAAAFVASVGLSHSEDNPNPDYETKRTAYYDDKSRNKDQYANDARNPIVAEPIN